MSAPVAFLDESGDESGKLQQGASPLFVVGLVVFTDPEEAARCRERIDRLRAELHKPTRFEFHFRDNDHADRLAFLKAVAVRLHLSRRHAGEGKQPRGSPVAVPSSLRPRLQTGW